MTITSLCKWIGVPKETDNMIYSRDKPIEQNSAFIKIDPGEKEILKKDNYNRQEHLSSYEKEVIQKINCPNLLSAMDYERQAVVIDFKHVPPDLDVLEYERTFPLMIKSYLSPLPPKRAIIISSKILFESFKLFTSVSISLTKIILNKLKKIITLSL